MFGAKAAITLVMTVWASTEQFVDSGLYSDDSCTNRTSGGLFPVGSCTVARTMVTVEGTEITTISYATADCSGDQLGNFTSTDGSCASNRGMYTKNSIFTAASATVENFGDETCSGNATSTLTFPVDTCYPLGDTESLKYQCDGAAVTAHMYTTGDCSGTGTLMGSFTGDSCVNMSGSFAKASSTACTATASLSSSPRAGGNAAFVALGIFASLRNVF